MEPSSQTSSSRVRAPSAWVVVLRFGRGSWRKNTKAEVFSTRDRAREWLLSALDRAPGFAEGFFYEVTPNHPHPVLMEEVN